MGHTQVTGAGLGYLAGLPLLSVLRLDGTPVDDAGLAPMRHLPRLRNLSLNCTKVTDAGLIHLGVLPVLAQVELEGTQVSEAGAHGFNSIRRKTGPAAAPTKATDEDDDVMFEGD